MAIVTENRRISLDSPGAFIKYASEKSFSPQNGVLIHVNLPRLLEGRKSFQFDGVYSHILHIVRLLSLFSNVSNQRGMSIDCSIRKRRLDLSPLTYHLEKPLYRSPVKCHLSYQRSFSFRWNSLRDRVCIRLSSEPNKEYAFRL